MTLDDARRCKYLIIRPDPSTGQLVVEAFKNKFELECYLNGCSNPAECIPALRLDLEYKLKCKKKV